MDHLKLANNYKNDILKSQKSPLLIELNQKDISHFDCQLGNKAEANFPFLVAQRIYDDALSNNTTNIIAIEGDSDQQGARFCLLESLLSQLGDEIKDIKNIATLKETLKTAASVATGGLLNEFVGSYLEKGVESIFEGVGEHFSQFLVDTVSDNINVSNLVIDNIEGFIQDTAGDSLADFISNASNHQLDLSSIAKTELDTLSKAFSKSAKRDVFQLTFKILLAISLESPKLIYINNPHKLDENSLAIISLVLSYAKHQKDIDKHVGISVVYTYRDKAFQPYCDVTDDLKEKQRLLDDQRRFAQRYALLERPSSDIPKVAVKSSLFVGRVDELAQLQVNFEQHNLERGTTVSVVSGEPGIGKTALVNKHLKQIETSKMITLTLLNEVGHSSSNTGLSSLEKSISEEAKRLALLKGWKDKGASALKGVVSRDNAFKVIGAIFGGADSALAIAAAGHERLVVERDIESIKQSGLGDLDNKPSNQKEQQFNKLDKAINALLSLSEPNLPLVLFIDDCQWIDNNSCEYILTRLAKKVSLYIVTTVRPSDAATLLKQQAKNAMLNEYSIALLKAIETNGHQDMTSAVDVSALSHSIINLTGFDKAALNELITLVIKGKSTQLEALTKTIFSEIAGQDATNINTLFAIESINMLCDDKLYSENETTRLIVDNPLRINSEITDVSEALKETFAILQSKYKDSLSHYEKSTGQDSFNLMAYAVLEERLHLLKLYFGGHGNAAVNTLLFSSLLGAPFSSTIVKKTLEALAETEEPLLAPLKAHINQSHQKVGLTQEHYAIIDEVYEILSRYALNDDKYKYRHALLHIFLDKQLEHLLDTLLTDETMQAKERMLVIILKVIEQEERLQPFFGKEEQALNGNDYTLMMFFKSTGQNIIKKLFEINPNSWLEKYASRLNTLAECYSNNNQIPHAVTLQEEACNLIRSKYLINPDKWTRLYIISLNNLGLAYSKNNQLSEATVLLEEALSLLRPLYIRSPEMWAGVYTVSLHRLSMIFHTSSESFEEEATYLEEEAIRVIMPLYQKSPVEWAMRYIVTLIDLAQLYVSGNRIKHAIMISEVAVSITKPLYKKKSTKWVELYINSLNSLAISYSEGANYSEAIALQKESLSLCKDMYQQNQIRWTVQYVSAISHLGLYYSHNGQLPEAITLQEEVVNLTETLCKQDPTAWAMSFTSSLNNLAQSLILIERYSTEATELFEKAVGIIKTHYKQYSIAWEELHFVILKNQGVHYQRMDQTSKAIELLEESLSIQNKLFQQKTERWWHRYGQSIDDLRPLYEHIQFEIEYNLDHNFECDIYGYNLADRESIDHLLSDYDDTDVPLKIIELVKKLSDVSLRIIALDDKDRERLGLYNDVPYAMSSDNKITIDKHSPGISDIPMDKYSTDDILFDDYALDTDSISVLPSDVIEYGTQAIAKQEAIKAIYLEYPAKYLEEYLTCLLDQAIAYYDDKQFSQYISLLEEAVSIGKGWYEQNPEIWIKTYSTSLNELARGYDNINQFPEAIEVKEEVLRIKKNSKSICVHMEEDCQFNYASTDCPNPSW